MVALCFGVAANAKDAFSLAPSKVLSATPHTLTLVGIATAAIIPEADASIPLRGANGEALGPILSDGQFCELAAAGSGVIGDATYKVVARKMPVAAGALGRSVFQKLDAPNGLGADHFRLVPWRSIAASQFPLGTVLFIPALRDRVMVGEQRHDGYVFVADRLGDAPHGQISLVVDGQDRGKVIPTGQVAGFRVDDPVIAEQLRRVHALP
jgi:hypothetical protein